MRDSDRNLIRYDVFHETIFKFYGLKFGLSVYILLEVIWRSQPLPIIYPLFLKYTPQQFNFLPYLGTENETENFIHLRLQSASIILIGSAMSTATVNLHGYILNIKQMEIVKKIMKGFERRKK